MSTETPPELRRTLLLCYAAPMVGLGGLGFFVLMYMMKYATDVLLVAPAAMGSVFALGRVWDAVSDPLVGSLSDRTRSRWGRRRPWIVASVAALALSSLALWSPPALGPAALTAWIAAAMLAYFTASTLFQVPHDSWGAELCRDHHERTRVFGYRHAGFLIGMAIGIAVVAFLIEAEDKREAALLGVGSLLALGAIGVSFAVRVGERVLTSLPAGVVRAPFHRAITQVWQNPHARVLLGVQFMERLGTASLSALGAYVAQYLVGDESVLPVLLVSFVVPGMLFVPVAARLSRRFGKRTLWLASMVVSSIAFGSLYFAGPGDVAWVAACAAVAGVGDTCGAVLGSSMQADVIDHDELRTGERREGFYFAAWSFAQKCAYGVAMLLTGLCLQLAGYEPGQPQTETTQTFLRLQMSVVPLLGYWSGCALLWRYGLGEREHAKVLEAIAARGRAVAAEASTR